MCFKSVLKSVCIIANEMSLQFYSFYKTSIERPFERNPKISEMLRKSNRNASLLSVFSGEIIIITAILLNLYKT
jgi:hypothetical protein